MLGVVFVHGVRASAGMWDAFATLMAGDAALAGVVAEPEPRFEYATGVFRSSWKALTVIPSISTAADSLKEYLITEAGDFERLVLVGHSQGGLVIQRCLARMLAEGRGLELARIRRVVLLATPNTGSELFLSARRALVRGNPQEEELRPFDELVADTVRSVQRDIVHAAAEPTERSCRIPFSVYAGEQDKVVTRASAQAAFPEAAVLPGDHSRIASPDSARHRTYTTVRRLLIAAAKEDEPPAPARSEASQPSAIPHPLKPLDPVTSPYLRQVARIAPPVLLDRDAELAELADFCTSEQPHPYAWWRAEAWAGKSALLSSFVLESSIQLAEAGIRVVSFFITARLAAQDTRQAFTTSLSEQLCSLLGVDLPGTVDEAATETVLLDLLAQAAKACQDNGGRLILVVDGLDEDRGTTTGPAARSIAALLPGRPPAGLRVVVAGRPNPPIPDDVPDWHPLRDPAIVRVLADSPHAQDVQRLSKSELKRLLTGNSLEQRVLGLLTAARGGLSGPDLRELTGGELAAIEEILHTVAGRTFTSRPAARLDSDGPQVYLLGHEELHKAAELYLGHAAMTGYCDLIHAWADGYREARVGTPPWPEQTPDYLITGYPRMLAAIDDVERMTTLALDANRHDRMLDMLGGDAAAMAEIKACQDRLSKRQEPDLVALAHLAFHRDRLRQRNFGLPYELATVWALLGSYGRAEAHARTISHPNGQAHSLLRVAEVLAKHGHAEQVRRIAADAETIARTIVDPDHRAWVLLDVAEVLTSAGEDEQANRLAAEAEQSAYSIVNPGRNGETLAYFADVAACAGRYERAERIARSITDPYDRAYALTSVAGVLATAGRPAHARRLAEDAEVVARTITEPGRQAWTLAKMGRTLATLADWQDEAKRLLTDADLLAGATLDLNTRDWALSEVARAWAAMGEYGRVERIAGEIVGPFPRTTALLNLEGLLASTEQPERCREAVAAFEREVDTYTASDKAWALQRLADKLAETGQIELAEETAIHITDSRRQAMAFASIAHTLAKSGNSGGALAVAILSEQVHRAAANFDGAGQAVAVIAGAVSMAGHRDDATDLFTRAEVVARFGTDSGPQAFSLAVVAREAAAAQKTLFARRLASDARSHASARNVDDPVSSLVAAAQALFACGLREDAFRTARSAGAAISDDQAPVAVVRDLIAVARMMIEVGLPQEARKLLSNAETKAHTISGEGYRVTSLLEVAETHAEERIRIILDAEKIALTITDTLSKADALANLAVALARAGRHEHALRTVETITVQDLKTRALSRIVSALAETGHHTAAEELVPTITDQTYNAEALADLAEAKAKAGPSEHARTLATRAENLVRTAPDPERKAAVLIKVAAVLGRPRSRQLLAEAFVLGSWSNPLRLLGEHYPLDAIQVAHAVYEDALR
ncbi:alpha/beta fold hydrolase [Catenulispora yoronensis]|uniref:alpha/beta fold hydrolase n=1 Tax=Catenulispora yoronensis TaxID=450799 RepID=UPI0031D6A1BC